MRKTPVIVVGATLLFGVILAGPATAAPGMSGNTTATFTLNAGVLSITAPASTDLGSASGGETATGQLGAVTVTDQRAALTASWIASASATAFTTGGGTPAETVPNSDVSYWSGPATATTGIGVFTPGQLTALMAQPLSTPPTAFTATLGVGSSTVTWNPSLIVRIPSSGVAGIYTGTITNSVA